MIDPTKENGVRTALNILRFVAILVFATVWTAQMYLSFAGPPQPSPASGAIYPVTIHGGVTFTTYWQSYFATPTAIAISFLLYGLNILLRRIYAPSHSFCRTPFKSPLCWT